VAEHEWCDLPRNARLLPGAIEDYDVLETPDTLSCEAALALDEIRRWHSKRWCFHARHRPRVRSAPGSAVGGLPGGRVLVVTGSHDASTTLYFDHLPDEVRAR